MNEAEPLAAAKRGDEAAFARLVDPYRRELHAHCYRMLGSTHDAEDALQDALLDAWRGLASFQGRSSLRSWLYTVTTNACLKVIRRRAKRVLPVDYGPPADPHDAHREPLAESAWIEPYQDEQLRYEQRETVELAFVAALQHLPARQRAVLILRDVLGFSAREAAEILDTKPPAIDSALQRAHKTVDERLPEQSQQATLGSLDDQRLRELVDGYVSAWESTDVDALVKLLADDAALAMPPQREWYAGREAVGAFLAARPMSGSVRWRVVPTRANGQLAFAHYRFDADAATFRLGELCVLMLEGDRIKEITAFRDRAAFASFDLPETLGAEPEANPDFSDTQNRSRP
jgi:RNA polymerase sigma-70 factor (ECF subfamily)